MIESFVDEKIFVSKVTGVDENTGQPEYGEEEEWPAKIRHEVDKTTNVNGDIVEISTKIRVFKKPSLNLRIRTPGGEYDRPVSIQSSRGIMFNKEVYEIWI